MKPKNPAIALMAMLSVCATFALVAEADPKAAQETAPPGRTPQDVSRIIAQQVAELQTAGRVREESRVYPFYSSYQSPGLRTVKGVQLRTVLKGSLAGEKPEDYNTRVVKFAPRKGFDIVDVDPRMPLREWTFTEEGFAHNVIPAVFQSDNRKLKAHLVGFRGIGYTVDEGEFKGEMNIPCILLRLPDGRVRMIETRYLSEEDLQFAAECHRAALADIRANRIPEQPRVIPGHVKQRYPNPTEPGVKNSHFFTESQFVVLISGTEHPEPGNAQHWVTWVNAMGDQKAGREVRAKACAWFDAHWLIFEYGGFYMPGIDSPEPRDKFGWFVGGPTIDGKGTKGGGGGWHIGNGSPGIAAHELGHMSKFLNGVRHGGGESWADSLRDVAFPTGTGVLELNTPFQHLFSSGNGYGYTYFYMTVGEDPSLGYLWFTRLPIYDGGQASADSATHLIAELFKRQRLTEYADKNMVNRPVEEFGDLFGEYAARSATFDNQKEYLFRNSRYSPPRQVLELIDKGANVWRVPADCAPQAQGFNVVRLVPETGAKEIEVDFRGLHDPSIYSDWRACIIAVEADGGRRYSDLWNKGPVRFPVKAGDRSFWLTVAATPTALKQTRDLCPGGHFLKRLPTYPWSVKLAHATVGTPARLAGEFGPKATRAGAVDTSQLLPHKNGGGLVAGTASVADTAYVGPNAMVLDNAKVLDHASIEGFAIVRDSAVVKDHARLYGTAEARGDTVVGGYSRYHLPVWTHIKSDIMSKNPLIPRCGEAKLPDDGLWANYAMMDTDRIHLHDYYRYKEAVGDNLPSYPHLNGYVFGKPEAVAYDDRSGGHAAGLQFNGTDQYATIHNAAMDIPQATIVIKLMVEPGTAGTIFDFGADKDNCMTLAIAADGTLQLNATVRGKSVVALTGSEKMVRSRPVRLRVELDGQTAALWMDKSKIAEAKTSFRACDVFPPDALRENLIASSRAGTKRLKALFDSVVIYAKVHDDFDSLLPPIVDAPPIVGDNVFKLLSQRLDPERQKKLIESAKNINEFYMLGSKRRPNYFMQRSLCADPKDLYENNALGKRWYRLLRRDPTYVKWEDEILPKMEAEKKTPEGQTEDAKKRHLAMEREFKEKIESRIFELYPDEARAIDSMCSGLYRTHWSMSYFGFLDGVYYPSLLGSNREELKTLTLENSRSKDPKGWIRSSDITVPLPGNKEAVVWSKEGILSGAYDKLQPTERQWYLHTQGPIKD